MPEVTFKRMRLSMVYGVAFFFFFLLFSHSVMSHSVTPWTAACQDSLSFNVSLSLLRLMSIESEMPCNHLIFKLYFSI